jgi:nucleoside-diphosphate-sugar epimerase
MKALVIGADNFIGSTLIGELDSLGFEVSVLLSKESTPLNLDQFKEFLSDYWICSNQKAKSRVASCRSSNSLKYFRIDSDCIF